MSAPDEPGGLTRRNTERAALLVVDVVFDGVRPNMLDPGVGPTDERERVGRRVGVGKDTKKKRL